MPQVMKLVDISDVTVEFSPLVDGGYSAPDDQARMVKKMIDGSIRNSRLYAITYLVARLGYFGFLPRSH
jgi:hypothetical protein